jgi:2-keto-4-pentenoate hydratase
MDAKLERLAAALAAAWNEGGRIPLPSASQAPSSRAEAYAVQDRMAELIGDRVAGWKVGATVEAVQRLEGHDGPIPGRLFASRVFDAPARVPGAIFDGYKLECEFAFSFTEDLPVRDRPYGPEEIADLLLFHLAVELAGTRYAPDTGGRAPTTLDAVADNGSGGGFLFGPAIRDWRDIPFLTLPLEARIGGGAAIRVYTGEYRRDPLEVAAETVNDLCARGLGLRAGDYLSTGSLTLPTPIGRGQTVAARFADLGTLSLTVDRSVRP